MRVYTLLCIFFLSFFLFFFLQYVVFIVVGTGLLFVAIFHIGVKEPPRCCTHESASISSKRAASNWTAWFREPQFYQVD